MKKDVTADLIRNAIRDLAGLLEGGAGITVRVDGAEKKAAESPRKKHLDLMRVNAPRFDQDGIRMLHAVREALGLACAAYGGKLTPERVADDIADYNAAQVQHESEGETEFDELTDPTHYVNRISRSPDGNGYYTLAWVWTATD